MIGLDCPEELTYLLAATAVVAGMVFFHRPLVAFFRLCARTGAGLVALVVLSPLGQLAGIGLGVNLCNALVLALLGGPGLGLLLMLHWLLK